MASHGQGIPMNCMFRKERCLYVDGFWQRV